MLYPVKNVNKINIIGINELSKETSRPKKTRVKKKTSKKKK